MKILFWLLAIASIPFSLFMTIVSWFANGLGLSGTPIGQVVTIVGMFAAVVSIVCVVLGIIKLCKGNVKKAVTLRWWPWPIPPSFWPACTSMMRCMAS